jgi:DMSO/TMAO reductase YedYZ molybdopterin-dependent catalytic subunit
MKIRYIVNLLLITTAALLIISLAAGCNIRGNIIEPGPGEAVSEENTYEEPSTLTGEGVEEGTGDLLQKLEEKQDALPGGAALGGSYPEVDGLHVTGNPVAVSISQYTLEVTGAVDNPLSLTFDEVKGMEPVRKFISLVCQGFFTDEGYWTGVEVRKLLELAQVKDDASKVRFIDLRGDYSKTLPIEKVIKSDGIIVAYHFNDKEFSEIHGYPLRIAADGEPGYIWVKWLGEIEVLTEGQPEDQPEEM